MEWELQLRMEWELQLRKVLSLSQNYTINYVWTTAVKNDDFEIIMDNYRGYVTGDGVGYKYRPIHLRIVNTVTGEIIPGELLGGVK